MPTLTLITSAPSSDDDTTAHARLIADWLAADRRGDVITAARIEWEAEQYDPQLVDELDALRDGIPAAA